MTLLAILLLASTAVQAPLKRTVGVVRVRESVESICFGPREYWWRPEVGGFRSPFARLDADTVRSIRAAVLAAPRECEDLLGTLGVTPVAFAAWRSAWIEAAWPEADRPPGAHGFPPELEPLVTFDRLAPRVRRDILAANPPYARSPSVWIELPGDPIVRIESLGALPYGLPWSIECGDRKWRSDDLAISRAIVPLLESGGRARGHFDADGYWARGFWSDASVWQRVVGRDLDEAWSLELARRLDGFAIVDHAFAVERASWLRPVPVPADSDPRATVVPSLSVDLRTVRPGVFDIETWICPWSAEGPAASWHDFLRVHADVERAIEIHGWIVDWRASSPVRTTRITFVGGRNPSMDDDRALVERAWKQSGLLGQPEFAVELSRKDMRAGTLWFSGAERSALISRAWSGAKRLPFDALDLDLKSSDHRFALVDPSGGIRVDRLAD